MLTDERYRQLMEKVGMPNSRSLLQALQQAVMEAEFAERERCRKEKEKAFQLLSKKLELHEVVNHVGTGEPAYTASILCDDWLKLYETLRSEQSQEPPLRGD